MIHKINTMDRNTFIGLTLIFGVGMLWTKYNAPTEAQLEAYNKTQDSIALVKTMDSLAIIQKNTVAVDTNRINTPAIAPTVSDSLQHVQYAQIAGPFAPAATGEEETSVLENEVFKITFTNKGGKIKEVLLKKHFKAIYDENGEEEKQPLRLLNDEENKFGYFLPIASLPTGGINTESLYFTAQKTGDNTISFKAHTTNGGYFEQGYTIAPDSYEISYFVNSVGLDQVLAANITEIDLNWVNVIEKLERSVRFERTYSTILYNTIEDGVDNCSWSSDDEESVKQPIKWAACTNQFFNSTLIAQGQFNSGEFTVKNMDETSDNLKAYTAKLTIPFTHRPQERFDMTFLVAPNDFNMLTDMGHELSSIVPYGTSILGTINRWIIRPLFKFLAGLVGNMGIAILLLTVIVKLILYPLTFKMLKSQSKMQALKPRIEKLKEKNGDDKQAQQVATMKLYSEYGVSPLGGCMPMLMQMPIWFALYRFFPAALEFRQAPFWWATDLSSFDVFYKLGFEMPLGMGSHISLFTVLWAITTLIYTYYNSKHMDMSANPAMKYMQYLMPVMFLGFFNSYASGLTAYLLFSNVFNILQTVITKSYIIDQKKLDRDLNAYKAKPKKKKSGFRARLQDAMEEQQRVKDQKDKKKKK